MYISIIITLEYLHQSLSSQIALLSPLVHKEMELVRLETVVAYHAQKVGYILPVQVDVLLPHADLHDTLDDLGFDTHELRLMHCFFSMESSSAIQ